MADWWETMRAPGHDRAPTRSTRCGCSTSCPRACRPTPSSPPTPARRPTGTPATCKFRGDMRGSLSGTLATMGPGVPYVIGAKFGPPRPSGDRVRRRRRHADERPGRADHRQALLAAVGRPAPDHRGAAQQRPQPGHLGDAGHGGRARSSPSRRRCPTSTTPPSPRSLGLAAIEVDTPEEIGPAWEQALAADRPTVLDVRTDPDVPPIPPHATFAAGQATAPRRSCGGDENAWGVLKTGISQKAQEFLPGTKDAEVMRRSRGDRSGGAEPAGRSGTSAPAVSSGAWPALAAAGALVTAAEIFTEHDGASFGNKMMWWPVVIVPTAVPAGVAAVFCRRAAKTVLPLASAAMVANGMQGTYLHWRGIAQRPGGDQPATTSRWGRRCSRRCWPHWWAAWGCWPRCCAAKGDARRATADAVPEPRASTPSPAAPRPLPGFDVLDQVGPLGPGDGRGRAGPARAPGSSRSSPHRGDDRRPLLDLLLAQHDEPRVPVLS